ncbi:MAG: SGNH/GDSL hydrolase family protein [Candidatus Micrarchaeota archaeon]
MVDTILNTVPEKKEIHILIVGPSWIVGMFPNRQLRTYEKSLEEKLGVPVSLDVVAKVGEGVGWMQKQLQQTLATHPNDHYDYVLFFPGRNDIMRKRTGDITQSISDTLGLLRDVGRVFVFNIQYSDKRLLGDHTYKVGRINDFLQNLVGGDSHISILDLYSYTRQHGLGYPLHPSVRGYTKLRKWTIDTVASQLVKADNLPTPKTRLLRL